MTTATRTAITRAAPGGAAALARTLARAFADDPVSAWFFPRDGGREERLARASALLAEVLDRCDRDRVPAYLEATTSRNRALYLRHGFEDAGVLRLPGDGPRLWPMWREPA